MDEQQQQLIARQMREFLDNRERVKIPKHILAWREGDSITSEHREVLASQLTQSFEQPDELERIMKASDSFIAESIAVLIAVQTGMNVETFKETFPTIAREHETLAVKSFLSWNISSN
jgi:D-alanyl-D-alanine carboxypeptidase